ncbi:unnamed protein product [Thelazia callipaeda]|uniref:Ephrin RBD domain-containing protein n=1 Tax=Thelazia callipaeda TaxID=103827 RepID=A0A0N5D4Y4_THECL|nr:unnamed protein product [Thelazia callipaeda]
MDNDNNTATSSLHILTLNVHLMDTIVIHCPVYELNPKLKDLIQNSILYLIDVIILIHETATIADSDVFQVSETSFDKCQLDTSSKMLGYCKPSRQNKTIRFTLKRHESKLGRFSPGRNYFIITASKNDLDGMHQRKFGFCTNNNMKVIIHVLKEPYRMMEPIEISADNSDEANKFIASKQKHDEVLFMTEEFNELTWKKKLYDPRIPHFEQQNFSYSYPTIAPFGNRVFQKFPKTHRIITNDQVIPFLRNHHEMRRQRKSLAKHTSLNGDKNSRNEKTRVRMIVPKFRNEYLSSTKKFFWPSEMSEINSAELERINETLDTVIKNDITNKVK